MKNLSLRLAILLIILFQLPVHARAEVAAGWWSEFNDTTLNRLISCAVDNNYDLRSAVQRIDIARQTLRQAQSAFYPQLQVNAGWQNMQESGMNVRHAGNPERDEYFALGLGMSWEVDIFGKIRAQAEADKAAYEATDAEYDAVMLALISNVATSYISLRVAQAQLQITELDLVSQQELLHLAETRYECGLVPQVDVVQGRVALQVIQASIISLKSTILTGINSIALLCGVYADLLPELDSVAELPELPSTNLSDLPADLLRQRPDVREAEKTVQQYAALAGVAKRGWLPTLTITGSIGTSAHIASNLFREDSFTWEVAPKLTWTLFDGLSRNAAIASAKAQLQESVEQYNLTLMTAVKETRNAIVTLDTAKALTVLLQSEVKNYARILQLQTDRYRDGLCTFQDVLNAQQDYLTARKSEVQSRGNELTAVVTVRSAIGGIGN
jgi:NodT family efflux transporter outer membrane factor (OMF) lipoprotein